MAKRKNPADLTRRNLKAAKKREATLAQRVTTLEQQVAELQRQKQIDYSALACPKCGVINCQIHG